MEFRHILNERHRQEVDFALVGLKGLSNLTPRETACSRVRTVSSVPSEECVIASHSHRAPSEHTGQAVNSKVRLTRSETKMTKGLTRATVHPFRSSSCRDHMLHPVAPRRLGPWAPPFRAVGSLGPHPFLLMQSTLVREYLFSVTNGS